MSPVLQYIASRARRLDGKQLTYQALLSRGKCVVSMKNKKVVKSSLSEVLLYNPRHISCRLHHQHHHHHLALRLRSPLPRPLSTLANKFAITCNKQSSLRMTRDPVLTSTVAPNYHSHVHTTKPLSFLAAAQPSTNGYPTHKQSPQPPFAVKDKVAIMGMSPFFIS